MLCISLQFFEYTVPCIIQTCWCRQIAQRRQWLSRVVSLPSHSTSVSGSLWLNILYSMLSGSFQKRHGMLSYHVLVCYGLLVVYQPQKLEFINCGFDWSWLLQEAGSVFSKFLIPSPTSEFDMYNMFKRCSAEQLFVGGLKDLSPCHSLPQGRVHFGDFGDPWNLPYGFQSMLKLEISIDTENKICVNFRWLMSSKSCASSAVHLL